MHSDCCRTLDRESSSHFQVCQCNSNKVLGKSHHVLVKITMSLCQNGDYLTLRLGLFLTIQLEV
jgi:hypothetical protein